MCDQKEVITMVAQKGHPDILPSKWELVFPNLFSSSSPPLLRLISQSWSQAKKCTCGLHVFECLRAVQTSSGQSVCCRTLFREIPLCESQGTRPYQTCHNVARVTQTLILIDSSPSYFHSGAPDLTPQTSDRGGKNKSLCIRPVGELWMHHERGQAVVRQGPTFISYRRWKQTCLIGSMNYRPMS